MPKARKAPRSAVLPAPKVAAKTGRPTKWLPDGPEAKLFLERVALGDRLKLALETANNLPWGCVTRWIATDAAFASAYAQARKDAADWWADKADAAVEDATIEDVQVARLRNDHYKWRSKVANPRHYGEKIDVTSGGESLVDLLSKLPPGSPTSPDA